MKDQIIMPSIAWALVVIAGILCGTHLIEEGYVKSGIFLFIIVACSSVKINRETKETDDE